VHSFEESIMKISAIQAALKELGYLHVTHAADDVWDQTTANSYAQACQAENLHPALWAQPSNVEQLPPAVRAHVESEGKPSTPNSPQLPGAVAAGPTAAEQEAARLEAERLENERVAQAAAKEEARKLAEATAAKTNIQQQVNADAGALETDANVTTPKTDATTPNEPEQQSTAKKGK
jgi:hypothetical protein